MSITLSGLIGNTYQGAQGIQGIQGGGGSGTQGVQGIQGVGNAGAQGIQGLQGSGTNGSQGVQGLQGLTGSGTQGTQGLQGSGTNGSQGVQGLQGPSGGGGGGGGITSTDDTSTNASFYPVMVNGAGTTSNVIVTTTKLYFNPSTGNMSATQFNTLSDARVKNNIQIIDDPFMILDSISGYKFTFADTGIPSVGVLAQQVEKVLPELVATNPNGDKTVSYSGIIGVLVEAVKELKVKIEK